MPSTYAHKKFGASVYKKLSGDLKETVAENKECFLAGLHGPDVLFFHKPGTDSIVAKTGRLMHKASFEEMYDYASEILDENSDAEIAYFAGCICHFMLDSACHPIVNAGTDETGMTHGKIEMEFDRYLLLADKKTPMKYPHWAHIPVSAEVAETASRFYKGVSARDFFLSLASMKTVLMACGNNSDIARTIVCTVMEKTGNEGKIASLVMSRQKSRMISEYLKKMNEKLNETVDETVSELERFYKNIGKGYAAPERFLCNFNGIREK